MKKLLSFLFITLLLISGCGSPAKQEKPAPAPKQAVATSAKTKTKMHPEGMYKVGKDIPAGEYLLYATSNSYFEIEKDSSGKFESVLANDNFHCQSYVTVADGQYLLVKRATFVSAKDSEKIRPLNGYLEEGMYKVGRDLPGGEYKAELMDNRKEGYIEVAKDSTHQMESIISNTNPTAPQYTTVSDGQYITLKGMKIKIK